MERLLIFVYLLRFKVGKYKTALKVATEPPKEGSTVFLSYCSNSNWGTCNLECVLFTIGRMPPSVVIAVILIHENMHISNCHFSAPQPTAKLNPFSVPCQVFPVHERRTHK